MKTLTKEIPEILSNTYLLDEIGDSEIADILKESSDIDEVIDSIQERIGEYQMIYYSNAMDYLAENDNSLTESLEFASEAGISIEDTTSEVLATLHIQSKMMQELGESIDELTELFNSLKESEDINENTKS